MPPSIYACSVLRVPVPGLDRNCLRASSCCPSDRVSRNVVIRSAPSRASPAVGALTRGESLKVIRETARWRQVRMSDGSTGYVSKAWTIVVGGPAITALGSPTKLHMIDVGTGLALFVEGQAGP
ncbi:SH3 domain-containing protein [Sphingomonas sediminicola]|uniref:SH3 domain-containing protein n=1 Tax=Sphingomonas sediminicola TaxID=386874 RepID=A0ABX6TA88_9SPHN|nr:SH3 domain-containing protein [Sphingomonas sediminicola]